MTETKTTGLSPQQMSEVLASLSSPETIDSPFGQLEFFDGVPQPDTVPKVYDALDLMRGIEVYLNAMPGASLVAIRRGMRFAGITSPQIIGLYPRANSKSLWLTPNTETTYGTTFLDLKAWGPTVVEAPPMSLCVVDDFWFRYVTDMGIAGPDQGKGGKYLFVPPGYDGDLPDGDEYRVFHSPTYANWLVVRAFGGVPVVKQTKVYPLSDADAPMDNEFIDMTDTVFNTVHSNDFSFFGEVDELLQEEPTEALDPERAGQLASIGLVHGTPFAPDERMRGILSRAAEIAAGMARTIAYAPRDEMALYGSWKVVYPHGNFEFLHNGARLLDARTQYHYLCTVVTPAMAHPVVGRGSVYIYTMHDSNGDRLDGARNYRLHIDANPPAKNFWSVDLYDTQTRSLLQVPSTEWPALASNTGTLAANDDGSYDLYFGPDAPKGKESNWIETLPGRSWLPFVRFYGPDQSWFDRTWTVNEFEALD